MLKKILKIFLICFGVLVMLYICWSVYIKIQIDKGNLIKWDNKFYTKEELKQAFPPQEYDVPEKNTPEEVYAEFRQALLDNDIEGALAQMSDYRKQEYIKAFKDSNKLLEWVKRLPENIVKENMYGNYASYHYINSADKNDFREHPVNFSKNEYGIWEIDSI
ncbi:MAG: hypothetical protein V1667_01390 [bacterium]